MQMPFWKKSVILPSRMENSDECKIDIKKSPDGSTKVRFRGKCSKDEIEIARENILSNNNNVNFE